VFLVSLLGVTIGRWLVDRKAPQFVRQGVHEDERADTDVFAAVRQPDGDQTEEYETTEARRDS
jgi:hypothetical protein